jgi:hypothetical protein
MMERIKKKISRRTKMQDVISFSGEIKKDRRDIDENQKSYDKKILIKRSKKIPLYGIHGIVKIKKDK